MSMDVPDRKAGDEPSPRSSMLQHGHFLGDAEGRLVQGQAVAEDDEGRPLEVVRDRTEAMMLGEGIMPVGVVVVLVDADAVEPHLGPRTGAPSR